MVGEEDAPRRKPTHAIGEKLDDLSIRDFDDRIAVLRAEIDRLEIAQNVRKQAALNEAGSIFRQ